MSNVIQFPTQQPKDNRDDPFWRLVALDMIFNNIEGALSYDDTANTPPKRLHHATQVYKAIFNSLSQKLHPLRTRLFEEIFTETIDRFSKRRDVYNRKPNLAGDFARHITEPEGKLKIRLSDDFDVVKMHAGKFTSFEGIERLDGIDFIDTASDPDESVKIILGAYEQRGRILTEVATDLEKVAGLIEEMNQQENHRPLPLELIAHNFSENSCGTQGLFELLKRNQPSSLTAHQP